MRRALPLLLFLLVLACPRPAGATPQVPAAGRLSVSSAEVQGNKDSFVTDITPDGRYVLVLSEADNFVAGDDNDDLDAFVRDTVAGTTSMVDLADDESKPDARATDAAISDDGRLVVFASEATNLVAGDTNGAFDVFVRDRTAGTTTRVSIDSNEVQANGGSGSVDISGDGTKVAFNSEADNLVSGDDNEEGDVFVRDLAAGTTARVSITTTEGEADGSSTGPSLDLNGDVVSFQSLATNLIGANDTNGVTDIYARRIFNDTTIRISVGAGGLQALAGSFTGRIDDSGTNVVFQSDADNIATGDGDGNRDTFLRDVTAGTLTRISVDPVGGDGDADSGAGAISGDARYVAFESEASDLVAGDTNGLSDVFRRDLQTGITEIVSVRPGFVINGNSDFAVVAETGAVAFESVANNLVPGDTNTVFDAFLAGEACDGHVVNVDLNEGAAPTAAGDVILGTPEPDLVDGLGGADRFCGGGDNDVFSGGGGNDRAFGGPGNDVLKGQDGADRLDGAAGNDRLLGGNQNDSLFGVAGNDRLEGGNGNDVLNGGANTDNCKGQVGTDRASTCETITGVP